MEGNFLHDHHHHNQQWSLGRRWAAEKCCSTMREEFQDLPAPWRAYNGGCFVCHSCYSAPSQEIGFHQNCWTSIGIYWKKASIIDKIINAERSIVYLAGGSALISQIISTFSSFAEPMRTTFSFEQTGASVWVGDGENEFVIFMESKTILRSWHWRVERDVKMANWKFFLAEKN